jgi:hypothetical protein
LLDSRFERLRRAVLDEIGQILDEFRGALAPEIVGLRKRETFLELVEDQQQDERLAGRVAQDVVAMVQKLPHRFSGHGDAGLRPLAGFLRRAEDRGLDLFGGRRRFARIVDAHVHRRRVVRRAWRVVVRGRRILGRTRSGQRFRRPGTDGAVTDDEPRGNPGGDA